MSLIQRCPPFQGIGIEGFHCIQRCQGVGIEVFHCMTTKNGQWLGKFLFVTFF